MSSVSSFPPLVSVLVCCLMLSGCEFSFSGNSSSGDNDYFEEPLSDIVEKYGPALESSNKFVSRFRDAQIDALHADFTDSLKESISIDDTRALHDTVIDAAGQMTEFLPQQWAFKTGEKDGQDVLFSTKIVVHESGELFYVLMFMNDGKYDKVQGIKINTRYSGERVIEGVNRILSQDP